MGDRVLSQVPHPHRHRLDGQAAGAGLRAARGGLLVTQVGAVLARAL